MELTSDTQKDYEIIPFHKDVAANQEAIAAFMARYISKPFQYLENVVGVELNFNKIFYHWGESERIRESSCCNQHCPCITCHTRGMGSS